MTDFRSKKLQEALRKGELFEYVVGENGYKYICPYADMPTYDEFVFISINEYYKTTKDESIWRYFKDVWIAVSADYNYSWFALYYLYLYLRHYPDKNHQPLNIEQMLPVIITNICKNKEALSHDQRWMGRGLSDGLWGNVTQMINTINENFGTRIKLD